MIEPKKLNNIPSPLRSDSEEINKIVGEELDEFYTRHPKCEVFTEIFEYLCSLEITNDVAADVAKSILWEEGRSSKAVSGDGRFVKRYTTEMVAALLNEAGRSWTDLCNEAREKYGIGKSRFAQLLSELHSTGGCYRDEKGHYGIKR